jgi:MoxR-like ATPase
MAHYLQLFSNVTVQITVMIHSRNVFTFLSFLTSHFLVHISDADVTVTITTTMVAAVGTIEWLDLPGCGLPLHSFLVLPSILAFTRNPIPHRAHRAYPSSVSSDRTANRPLVSLVPRTEPRKSSVSHAAATATGNVETIGDLDPLLTRVLLEDRDADFEEEDGELQQQPLASLGSLLTASRGLRIWRDALERGIVPEERDFPPLPPAAAAAESATAQVWPPEPLFACTCKSAVGLDLPRFVVRHPEASNAVLLCILRLVMQFAASHQVRVKGDDDDDDAHKQENEQSEEETRGDESMHVDDDDADSDLFVAIAEAELIARAEELVATGLTDEFGSVVSGVRVLDQLFGFDHGLLVVDGPMDQMNASSAAAFGLHDGLWQHTGWNVIPDLQDRIASMAELRHLLNRLGRRPTAERSQRATHRFPPRRPERTAGMGAVQDPMRRTEVSGLCLSNRLAEMLPSEAVLLRGSPALRRLFWAKTVESKLQCYELSGWTDVPSMAATNKNWQTMPSASGGPLIVCLDTSWSMTGSRELLSKAVVLACVSAAHRQGRGCQVVAFSNANGVMDAGVIGPNKHGILRLLEFLSHSFGGGTDVTGALQYVIANSPSDETLAAADLLLVTDGEISDPPVSVRVMEDLDRLKRRTGMEIHGLLVGKRDSETLSKLCTHVHDFLLGYEMQQYTPSRPTMTSSALRARPAHSSNVHRCEIKRSSCKYGWRGHRLVRDRANDGPTRFNIRAGRFDEDFKTTKKEGKCRNKSFDDDLSYYEDEALGSGELDDAVEDDSTQHVSGSTDTFQEKVDHVIENLQNIAQADITMNSWQVSVLDEEKNAEGSCWSLRGQLHEATQRVAENLVEREEEARLVVLGMVAGEHVLMLGKPGTAKSQLGRRLSMLCGGPFFQRLLTRFTTPEEIFGPLSLRALENDEYRRCTDGFLPKASVAFLDEIFKANSAILNTLLTILNERQFDNGAGTREDCPIRCVIAASNELPDSDELDALYDRFLLRKEVLSVSDEGLKELLTSTSAGTSPCDGPNASDGDASECDVVFTDGLDNLINMLSMSADSVRLEDDVCNILQGLRTFMVQELDVDISDRRLVKAARLLKVSAASHGRTRVDPIDCLLLQHIAWRLPEQTAAVKAWLWDNLTPGTVPGQQRTSDTSASFMFLLDRLRQEAVMTVRKTSGDVSGNQGARKSDVAIIESLRSEVSQIAKLARCQTSSLERHIELSRRSADHLWLNPDKATAIRQLLIPRAEKSLFETNYVLRNALALELSLSADDYSLPNEQRLAVLEQLWDGDAGSVVSFSEDELDIGMKEAKAKYDKETFRRWKRERKKLGKV